MTAQTVFVSFSLTKIYRLYPLWVFFYFFGGDSSHTKVMNPVPKHSMSNGLITHVICYLLIVKKLTIFGGYSSQKYLYYLGCHVPGLILTPCHHLSSDICGIFPISLLSLLSPPTPAVFCFTPPGVQHQIPRLRQDRFYLCQRAHQ